MSSSSYSSAIGSFVIGYSPIGVTHTSLSAGVQIPPVCTFYLEWNGDLVLNSAGSVQMAVGWDMVRERIIRRFLTNSSIALPDGTSTPPDYIFSPLYGLGAGALIDENPDASFRANLNRRMREAVVADSATAPGALPSIAITTPAIGFVQVFVTVQLISGEQGSFAINLT